MVIRCVFPALCLNHNASIAAMFGVFLCSLLVHVWPINKDLSVHVTEVCGQHSAAPCGLLLDSEAVD